MNGLRGKLTPHFHPTPRVPAPSGIETVKVVSPVSDENPHGYIVINKDDLTAYHELFVGLSKAT